MRSIRNRLVLARAHVEAIVHLGSMVEVNGRVADQLRDLLDEVEEADLIRLFPSMPKELFAYLDDSPIFRDEFLEWADSSGTLGFVVQMATPVDRSATAYYTCWLYGASFEEAIDRGLVWVADRRAAEKGGAA